MRELIEIIRKPDIGRCALRAARFSLFVVLLAVMAGCGTVVPQKPTGEFYWPSPPDPPKIKWVNQWSGRYDFVRPNPILTFLIGEERGEALTKPAGVVADPAGNIYVADTDRGTIFVFDLEKNTLRFLGEGMVSAPTALAIDTRSGLMYVADGKQKKVNCIDYRNNKFVRLIGAAGEFQTPAGVAYDEAKERLYVSDSKAHLVKAFDKNGKYLFTIGKRGDGDGEFNFPGYLAFRNGKLYVSDTLNYRVQIFDAEGKFISKIGKLGDRPGFLSRPKGIGVDSEGHIYVVDAAFNNFQIFDEAGQILLWVGHTGRDAGGMDLPSGLYVDQQDRVYVSDSFNKRVQVFQYLK